MTTAPQRIALQVPATSANLGPGFDSFGMALCLYNRFRFAFGETDRDLLSAEPACQDQLKDVLETDPQESLICQSLDHVFQAANMERPPVHIVIGGEIPPARGLGSSASAVIAALVAGNEYLNQRFSPDELAAMATAIEGHPDNVVPALMGGVCICDGTDVLPMTWPKDWGIAALIPTYPISTSATRKILPTQITMDDAIHTVRKTAWWVAGVMAQNPDWFAKGLDDRLHQPYRTPAITEWEAVDEACRRSGTIGMVLSGSGPTMAVFYHKAHENTLTDTIAPLAQEHGFEVRLTEVDSTGAQLLPE